MNAYDDQLRRLIRFNTRAQRIAARGPVHELRVYTRWQRMQDTRLRAIKYREIQATVISGAIWIAICTVVFAWRLLIRH